MPFIFFPKNRKKDVLQCLSSDDIFHKEAEPHFPKKREAMFSDIVRNGCRFNQWGN